MEPFEFTSNGGGGEALPRRVKRRNATFYEVINSLSSLNHLGENFAPVPPAALGAGRGHFFSLESLNPGLLNPHRIINTFGNDTSFEDIEPGNQLQPLVKIFDS